MFLKRSRPAEPVLSSTPPAPDPSVRRQGAVEALNLLARSVSEAVATARSEVEAKTPDNFVAGQFMALGQIMSCIERERDLLQQQLMHEAGLHASAGVAQWDEEMKLLAALPVTSEELFRLAMDYRKVEDATATEDSAEVADEANSSSVAAGSQAADEPEAALSQQMATA